MWCWLCRLDWLCVFVFFLVIRLTPRSKRTDTRCPYTTLFRSQGGPAKWACAVFLATSILLFGNSALYHRFDWKPRTRAILKRIDHANILLLIAGTYTPLAVLALPTDKTIILLSIVWGGAVVGIFFRFFCLTAARWL